MTEGVSIRIGSSTDGLDEGVRHSKSQLKSLKSEMSEVVKATAALTAAAAVAGAALITGLAVQGLAAVDAQAKLARQLDGTITGLRALEGAAGDAGVSSEALGSAMQRLNRTIGMAQGGNEAAAKSFERLGLNAQDLSRMDVDQRMAAIADAVQDLGLSSSETASALADMGIRQQEIVNLATQGGDAIRAERDTVNALGLSLSAIDAAQVEAANDAMGVFADIMTGIRTQLAVEVAPLITAIASMLEQTAIEAGGVGEATSEAFGYIVESAAFVISSIDGIKRTFELVADGIIVAFSFVAEKIAETMKAVLEQVNRLPGIDVSEAIASLDDFATTAGGVVGEAMDNMVSTLERPLAGETFKVFAAEAREQSRIAAEAVVGNQQLMAENVVSIQSGMTEKQIEETNKRLEEMRVGFLTEQELLIEKYAVDLELLRTARENELLTIEEYDLLEQQLKQQHTDALYKIQKSADDQRAKEDQRREQERAKVLSSAWSGLTTLMNSESRKMFEIGKAAAIAQAIVSTYTGMTKALELGFPLGLIAAAAVGAVGFANIASIRSQSFGSGGGAAGSVTQQISGNTAPAAPANQQQQPQNQQTLTVSPIDPNAIFSGSAMAGFGQQIYDYSKDGGKVVFAA